MIAKRAQQNVIAKTGYKHESPPSLLSQPRLRRPIRSYLASAIRMMVLAGAILHHGIVSAQVESISFGDVPIGQSSTPNGIGICNSGGGDIHISGITITGSGANQFTVVNDTCSGRDLLGSCANSCNYDAIFKALKPGAANVTVQFAATPSSFFGTFTAVAVVVVPPAPYVSSLDKAIFATDSLAAAAAGVFFDALEINPECLGACSEIAQEANEYFFGAALAFAELAGDPYDGNFTTLQTLGFFPFPTLSRGVGVSDSEIAAFNALSQNHILQIAYLHATQVAINRSEGAAAASNFAWQQAQLTDAKHWAFQALTLSNAEPTLRQNLFLALAASDLPSIQIMSVQANEAVQQIAANGLPSPTVSYIQSIGADVVEMAQAKQIAISAQPTGSIVFPSAIANTKILEIGSAARGALTSFVADRNNDQSVDCNDLNVIRASFGSRAGDPNFDARADVNSDGVVNVADLTFVARALPLGTICH